MNQAIKNIYIHLPFCVKKCHFCAFPVHAIGINKTEHTNQILSTYFDHLKNEINFTKQILNSQYHQKNHQKYINIYSPIETIYFGGGTPSLFNPQQISELINLVQQNSHFHNKNTEISLELNPQEIQMIPQFRSAGVNRFSIGIQSLNPYQLKKFNRSESFYFNLKNTQQDQKKYKLQYFENICQKLLSLKKNKYLLNFNVDFILDLNPQKEDEDFIYKFIEKIQPPHLTLYLLEVIQNTYLEKKIKAQVIEQKQNNKQKAEFSKLVQKFETIHERYIQFSKILKEKFEYSHYEVSNFAHKKKTKNQHQQSTINQFQGKNQTINESTQDQIYESKHNKVYWQGNKQFIGFGMGASSLLKQNHLNPYYHQLVSQIERQRTQQFLLKNNKNQNEIEENNILNKNSFFRTTNPRSLPKYQQYVNDLQSLVHKKKQIDKQQEFIVEVNIESYPSEVMQSYIMSSIRTSKGVRYSKISQILSQNQQLLNRNKISIQEQLIKLIEDTLNEQFINQQTEKYFQYIFEENQTTIKKLQIVQEIETNNNIDDKKYKTMTENPKLGFRLNSPHGYLIADEIANRICISIQEFFTIKI